MSEYVSFYLKNKKTNTYTPLFSYGGYIRDSFSAMIGNHIAHFVYKDKDYRLILTIVFVLIWSCVEEHLMSFDKNIFLIFFLYFIQYKEIDCLKFKNIKLKLMPKK